MVAISIQEKECPVCSQVYKSTGLGNMKFGRCGTKGYTIKFDICKSCSDIVFKNMKVVV